MLLAPHSVRCLKGVASHINSGADAPEPVQAEPAWPLFHSPLGRKAKFYRNFGFRQFSVKTGLELSIPYAPTLRSSTTIDSKQLVFLNLNKNLAAMFVFKGLIFRF